MLRGLLHPAPVSPHGNPSSAPTHVSPPLPAGVGMSLDASRPAPFGALFLSGPLLDLVPPKLMAPALSAALRAMIRRHPGIFRRLEPLGEADFVIDPIDLPVWFRLRPAGVAPSLTLHRGAVPDSGWTAALRAPFVTLIDLLEGRLDGDAAFFGRDIAIEGDMEAVLTLRNALEEGEVRVVRDLLPLLGPAATPVRRLLDRALPLAARAEGRLRALQASLLHPNMDRLSGLEADLADLRTQMRDRVRKGRNA